MNTPKHIAVIDIGKTNAKLALVDLASMSEIAVLTRPNTVLPSPPWPHFDTEGHWEFLLLALAQFHRDHGVDAISITTHGASVVLLDAQGGLAAPILDYEHDGPASVTAAYDAIRPDFDDTGSPRLANGLNVGAQLHWQFHVDPALRGRTAHVLTYPQYWGQRLTGEIACDVTSIGCHTDLWKPGAGTFSDLIHTLDIADKMAPVRQSTDILGTLLAQVAIATGLRPDTPVSCGIHDSNASLFPHLVTQSGAFSVVSTGTWVIAMSIGGAEIRLDPARDTLMNVNAYGDAVPSARFMGGREFEIVQQGKPAQIHPEHVESVLESDLLLLPAIVPTTGPYKGANMRWRGPEPAVGSGERAVALSFYLALVTARCLRLIGAKGPTIVEGPFAENRQYLAMLQAATGRTVMHSASATGTSIGAALLVHSAQNLETPTSFEPDDALPRLQNYAAGWQRAAQVGSV